MKHTSAQQQAIQARGNVLVVAGAGTGKTRTLVDRCLSQITDEASPTPLREILMVTFTEAAATEMRERLARSLESLLAVKPQSAHLQETLAQVDAAPIGTLHGFCYQLIRHHFHQLDMDPNARIMEPEECSALCEETLDALLEELYQGTGTFSRDLRDHMTHREKGREKLVRELVLRIHHFTQSLVDPQGWLHHHIRQTMNPSSEAWDAMLPEAFLQWASQWHQALSPLKEVNPHAARCVEHLTSYLEADDRHSAMNSCVEALTQEDAPDQWPRGSKQAYRSAIADLFDDLIFLRSLMGNASVESSPLQADWSLHRPTVRLLLELAQSFTEAYRKTKSQRGLLDFADLEQHAIDLLWDRSEEEPTDLARDIQRRYHSVYVDEYQDINGAQDCILSAISKDPFQGNRFLVGDIKQSIYAFRLASPRFFKAYQHRWEQTQLEGPHHVIYLKDNFRSHPGILDFVNAIFRHLMYAGISESDYLKKVALNSGAFQPKPSASDSETASETVVHCRFICDEEHSEIPTMEKEAMVIAKHFRRLHTEGTLVRDPKTSEWRPVAWHDMAILVRSTKKYGESFLKVFHKAGIPLVAAASELIEEAACKDLHALVQMLYNPHQDIPLVAILRSPFFHLDDQALAWVRIHHRKGSFWAAMNHLSRDTSNPELSEGSCSSLNTRNLHAAIVDCVIQIQNWRKTVQPMSLIHALEWILDTSCYREKLMAADHGEEALMHVQAFLQMARRFAQHPQGGWQPFLNYLDQLKHSGEGAPVGDGMPASAVSMLTIHKSKGLEFPVVAIPGLNAPFNRQSLHQPWMLDETIGLAGMIQPPGQTPRYPSLPLWTLKKQRQLDHLEQEKRLLYVAFTRARDYLLLVSEMTQQKMDQWSLMAPGKDEGPQRAWVQSPMEWIFPWLCSYLDTPNWWHSPGNRHGSIAWDCRPLDSTCIKEEAAKEAIQETPSSDPSSFKPQPTPAWVAAWFESPPFQYPYETATRQSAKAAVTQLKTASSEPSVELPLPWISDTTPSKTTAEQKKSLSGTERGHLHHHFLQWVDLSRLDHPTELSDGGIAEVLEKEVMFMVAEGKLPPESERMLDLPSLEHFFRGEVGRHLIRHAGQIQRELPFTAKFQLDELIQWGLSQGADLQENPDFVVVQGMVDVAIIQPESIQILDYKTDQVSGPLLEERIKGYHLQLRLYAEALQRVYRKPVTHLWLHLLATQETRTVATHSLDKDIV